LLNGLLAELKITEDLFLQKCSKAAGNRMHQKLVDQIIAFDSFEHFKNMMIKKTSDINNEALRIMLKRE
jgi:hypothetical protein